MHIYVHFKVRYIYFVPTLNTITTHKRVDMVFRGGHKACISMEQGVGVFYVICMYVCTVCIVCAHTYADTGGYRLMLGAVPVSSGPVRKVVREQWRWG